MSSDLEAPSSTTPHASRLAVLLFTDLVGSTGLKSRFGTVAFARLLARHDAIFKQLIAPVPMAEILQDTGDGYFASFATTADALQFALQFQSALRQERWDPADAALRARIGIHMGEIALIPPSETGGKTKVVGMAADVAARVMSLGMGGQILLTHVAFDEARQFVREHPVVPSMGDTSAPLPPLKWMAHGEYLFKGTSDPIEVFEVGGEGIAPLTPPPDTDKARRSVSAIQEETLGWRPAVGLEVPQRVGWTLTRKLGEGTFGEVWLARSETTKQTRVFKFCFDAERLRSFKREVTFFRLLRDVLGERDDIAQLYDVRLNEPPFFLESEFASGGNLLDWATSKGGIEKVPLETRIDLVARVADAVAAAHSVGILHKDIKPSNILVHEQNGTPMPQLADFGIGMLTDKSQLQSHHITEAGFTLLEGNESSRTGTRMYAPPESLAHKPFTIQGDVYALGVLLYQMLVGDLNRPLAEGWEREVGDEFLREDVAACVDGDPTKRLSSATELARRLRSIANRKAQRQRELDAMATHERHKQLLRAARLLASGCALIAVVSAGAYFREHALYQAISISEAVARKSERDSQVSSLGSLLVAGDSLVQSKRYAEANGEYEQAWKLSESLALPATAAISGLLQSHGESPPALLSRHATTRPDEPTSPLVRVRIAPSGKVLVVGDANGHAYVMDLPMLRRIAVVPIDGWCYGVGFSSDGKSCYFGGSRGELSSWDVGQWQTPRESGEKTAFVYALTVSSDGQTVVTVEPTVPGHTGGRIHFWSARPLKRLHTIETPAGVLSAAFSPDDKMLATGDEKGGLTLWEVATRNRLGVLPGHTAEVPGIAFTPDGRRLLSGSFDRTVRLWDVADRRELLRFSTHRGAVREVTVSHDGRWGASAGDDELIKCWDLQQGTEATTYSRHPRGATSLAFLPDDSAIVSCGDSGGVSIWPLRGNDTPSYKLHGVAGLSSVSICPDQFTALSAGADGVVNQFDLSNGQVLRSVTLPRQPSCVVVSPDQRTALVGGVEGMLQVLDLKNFTLRPVDVPTLAPPVAPLMPGAAPATSPTSRPSRPRDYVQAIAFAPLGELAFAGGWDSGGLLELKMPGGSPSWARSTDNRVLAAAFTPDGRRALVSIVRDLYLIDVANAHVIKVTHTTARPILCVAIAPDGKTAATGGYDHPIKLWDPQDVRYMNFMAGHLGPVRAVTFFPDSRTLASASEDNTVRLWDVETLNEVRSFTGHTGGTCALSVSRDGSILATSDRNGVVRTWDLNRETTYRAVARDLESCFAALDEKPDEPSMLKRIGEWFAFRGRNDWAADCFDRARAGGAMISPLIEARCDWELGRSDAALTALSQAEAQGTAPREYLELCTAAIRASGSSRPSSDGDRNRQQ